MTVHCAAVVLAAGGASRMGRPKQLLTIGGESLVARAVRSAREAKCDPVVVVTGASGREVRRAIDAPHVVFAFHRRWRSGIASSIRAGLRHIGRAETILILLADQPFVGAPLLRLLIGVLESSGRTIAACRYGGAFGAPALFRRCWLEDLRRLPGDRGAGSLLARNESAVAAVDFAWGAVDIDTPEDAERWLPRVLDQPDVTGLAIHPRIDEEAAILRNRETGPALIG